MCGLLENRAKDVTEETQEKKLEQDKIDSGRFEDSQSTWPNREVMDARPFLSGSWIELHGS